MSTNDYHFVTHWRIKAKIEDVFSVLSNILDYPRWCPQVYLAVKEIHPGGADHIGRVMEMHTKGRLPYTIHWFSRLADANMPYSFSIEASGDFQGGGVWTLARDGRHVDVTFDWRIRAEKPLLKYLSFLLKPIFSANHRWAMARCEEGLRSELARRAGAGQHSAAQSS